jgi:predicted transcriptional regulator
VAGEQPALLRVRPRFADALLDGTKTVEVRRRPMRLRPGALCLLYSSSPTRALTGALSVACIDHGTPDELWRRHGPRTALTRNEYDDYLDGRPTACALLVAAIVGFDTPVPLADLRRRSDAFVAPQSYRFLHDGELKMLLNGHSAEATGLTAKLSLQA